jgi:acyl carrier protein
MTARAFLNELERILQMPAASALPDTVLSAHTGWDSIGVMEFIIFVDDNFGITIPAHEINACETIGDLMKLCDGHIAD